jgi:hypothetical protein
VIAYVTLCIATGQEIVSVAVDDYDPFVVMTLRGTSVALTRDECRKTADALRAAALRRPDQVQS